MSPRTEFRSRRQQGMALLIALIVLVVVSILGVVAMRTALFQSRVSVNSQTENLAFQAAETGLDAVVSIERRQLNGEDLARGTPDDIPVSDARNIFNLAVNEGPQQFCVTEDEPDVFDNPDLLTAGTYNGDGSPGYSSKCDPLPDSNARVTTVVGRAPGSSMAAIEGSDFKYGGGLILIQVRAYGEVPSTNVESVHAEEWGIYAPADPEGG